MKIYILLLSLLLIGLIGKTQTYTSSKLSIFSSTNDLITISDELGNQLITIESNFKNYKQFKKKIKIFSVNNQTYFITKEAKGTHLVYTKNWKLIAQMNNDGKEIIFPNKQAFYKKKKNKNWFNHTIEYLDEKDNAIAHVKVGNKRRLECSNQSDKKTDFLLIALSVHQLQEQINRAKNNEEIFLLFNC